MDINVFEFDSIMHIVTIIVDAFSGIVAYLGTSLNDILPINLPAWLGGNLTPLGLMLGIGLPTFVMYTLIIWVGNSVT